MDFNDLSRRWQHQPATAPAIPANPEALRALLANRPHLPVAQKRRNVWVEIGGTLVFGLLVLGGLHLAHAPGLNRLLLGLLPLYGGIGYCYGRTLQVLRRLGGATDALAGHVARQLRELRRLERLYLYSVLLATLVLLGLGGYVAIGQVLPRVPAAAHSQFLAWAALTALASIGLTYWLSRRHLQHFYGQHLDRLETVLHELHKDAPDAPAVA